MKNVHLELSQQQYKDLMHLAESGLYRFQHYVLSGIDGSKEDADKKRLSEEGPNLLSVIRSKQEASNGFAANLAIHVEGGLIKGIQSDKPVRAIVSDEDVLTDSYESADSCVLADNEVIIEGVVICDYAVEIDGCAVHKEVVAFESALSEKHK